VTFNVAPGTYPEFITLTPFPGMGSGSPVVFRANGGTVTVNPSPTTVGTQSAITLQGCQYMTFDGINVVDASSTSNWLLNGYFITNNSATQGSQNNTIKNASITLRKDFGSNGLKQCYSFTPSSTAGAQSNNKYLNLKISKTNEGVVLNSNTTYPDLNIEIGSDSVGLNYSKRFIIGALENDTISYCGIEASGVGTLTIHDIDVRNVNYVNPTYGIYGISVANPTGSSTINNCRVLQFDRYNYHHSFRNCLGY